MLKLVKRIWGGETEGLPARGRITIPAERVSNIFVIGDVHGCLDLLMAAEERIYRHIGASAAPALVICVGDYVDRGPKSKGVIDHLRRKMPRPLFRISICGNHDDMFMKFVRGDQFDPAWLNMGGDQTLLSYGVDVAYLLSLDPKGELLRKAVIEHVPDEHVRFLENLSISVTIGNYLFVHAGISPGVPLSAQTDSDLMWIREPFLSEGPGLDMVVVHGHTPSSVIQFGPGRIGVDTGAYATGILPVLNIGPDGLFVI